MQSPPTPRISIVLEWENALKAGERRAEAMLDQLALQSREICSGADPCIELISVFDPSAIEVQHLRDLVERKLSAASQHVARSYLSADGKDYYVMKNLGARAARAPLIMFLDSDVIPEPRWLAELLATCDTVPDAGVVTSTIYLESQGLSSATLALIWVFPLRPDRAAVVPCRDMRTNSTVFRRDVALAHPFSEVAGTARSSCALLTQELLGAGVQMVRTTSSRLEHPSVHGIEFFARAIARGRDAVVAGKRPWRVKFAVEIRTKMAVLIRQHKMVGIASWQLPAAVGIAVTWWVLNIGGAVATLVAPRFMRRHFLL